MKPEEVQHFPGNPNIKTRFINDEELEHYLGADHPLVLEVKEKLKSGW